VSAAGLQGILTLSCPDRMGIVAAVSRFLFEQNCNIVDSSQFGDRANASFFLRTSFDLPPGRTMVGIEAGFADIARDFSMQA
jgi:formyltetrahydrofolate deformylase